MHSAQFGPTIHHTYNHAQEDHSEKLEYVEGNEEIGVAVIKKGGRTKEEKGVK
jgi:hypothetical protein